MTRRSRGIARPRVSWAQREKRYEPYFSEKFSIAIFEVKILSAELPRTAAFEDLK
jgi:hypothetical protein